MKSRNLCHFKERKCLAFTLRPSKLYCCAETPQCDVKNSENQMKSLNAVGSAPLYDAIVCMSKPTFLKRHLITKRFNLKDSVLVLRFTSTDATIVNCVSNMMVPNKKTCQNVTIPVTKEVVIEIDSVMHSII